MNDFLSSNASAVFTLVGSLSTLIISTVASYAAGIRKEREGRRRDALDLAFKNWTEVCAIAKDSAPSGQWINLPPIDPFVIHAVGILDIAESRGLSERELKERLAAMRKAVDIVESDRENEE